MAAPPTAYLDETILIKRGVSSEVLSLPIDLVDYGGDMASLFYVDFFLRLKDVNTGTFIGLIGIVENNPSNFNYNQHNVARLSKLQPKRLSNGKKYLALLDGALNTKPETSLNTILLYYSNYIRCNYTFKSAFYVDTDFEGVRYRIGAGSWTELSFGRTLAQGLTETLNLNIQPFLTEGDDLELQAVIKNAEGTSYSTSKFATLLSAIFEVPMYKRASLPCDTSTQTIISVWMTQDTRDALDTVTTTPTTTGIILYTDIEQTLDVGSGWFVITTDDRVYFCNSGGEVTHYEICSIATKQAYISAPKFGSNYSPVLVTLSETSTEDITITGRVDINEFGPDTSEGMYFSVFIASGGLTGQDDFFSLPDTYPLFWKNVVISDLTYTPNLAPII